jgi:uncharacterized membrane protein
MSAWYNRLRAVHDFLVDQALYPIVLSTLLTAGLFISRAFLNRGWGYYFLPWNLFLAWIPYLSSLIVAILHRRYPRRWTYLLLPGLLWLAFFPNAPYLITDFVHLGRRFPIPIWYDIVLLVTAAWTGLSLAIFSLRAMQSVVKAYFGLMMSWLFAFLSLGLSGLGIYLGRFLRWNSWDLVINPGQVLADVAFLLSRPLENFKALGFITLVAAFMFVCYLTLTVIPRQERL